MTLDVLARKAASKTISKYGKRLTLIRVAEGVYDTATGSTTNVDTPTFVYGIVEDFKGNEIDGSFVLRGDKKITLPALDIAVMPIPSDKITIDAITFTIVNVETVMSGELAALYIVQGRKS